MVDKFAPASDGMKWSFTLRDGLKFHDGQPVAAEDAWSRSSAGSKRDPLGRLLAAHTARLAPVDRKTFTLELVAALRARPRSPRQAVAQRALHHARPPRRHARQRADQGADRLRPVQVRQGRVAAGNQVVYVRNADYVPRSEPPSGSAGGKRRAARSRRVALSSPTPPRPHAALEAGEVDWWESPPLDFVPRIEQNPALATFMPDPRRHPGLAAAEPPAPAVQQQEGAAGAAPHGRPGDVPARRPSAAEVLPAMPGACFTCGGAVRQSAAGAPAKPDLERAQAAREGVRLRRPAGRGRCDPTDIALTQRRRPGHARAAARRSASTSTLQAMDWSTVVARRAKKEPPDAGRLEHAVHLVDRLRRHAPRRARRRLRRRRRRLVRLARAAREIEKLTARLGAGDRPGEAASSSPRRSRRSPTTR